MTSLPEQLTAARTAQLEAQFALFRSVTRQALDNASRVLALNISTSRDSVERSSQAVRQLFAATSPQDLPTLQLALRSHAEEQFRSLFAYGRELFSIASGAQTYALRSAPTPAALSAPAPAPAQEEAVAAVAEAAQPVVQAASAAAQTVAESVKTESEQLAAYVQEHVESKEPAVVAETVEVIEEPAPVAEPKPIAKAAGKGAPKAAVLPHPLSAPVPEGEAVEVPKIEPAPVQGGKRRK